MSTERVEADLDLIKVVRNMRNFKILLSSFLMTPKVKFEIAHQAKNVLDLNDTVSEDQAEQEDMK